MNNSRFTAEEQEQVRLRIAHQRKAEQKEIWKEVLTEWLEDRVRMFGWWSIRAITAAFLVGVLYLALISSGWHK